MILKVKRMATNAKLPQYAHPTDAGMDLVATWLDMDDKNKVVTYGTGIAVEIPEGYVGMIFPRSSIYKTNMDLCNSVGIIDSSYRGEIKFKFYVDDSSLLYMPGDRIGQLIILPYPKVDIVECDELSESDRGNGGFGSSGI